MFPHKHLRAKALRRAAPRHSPQQDDARSIPTSAAFHSPLSAPAAFQPQTNPNQPVAAQLHPFPPQPTSTTEHHLCLQDKGLWFHHQNQTRRHLTCLHRCTGRVGAGGIERWWLGMTTRGDASEELVCISYAESSCSWCGSWQWAKQAGCRSGCLHTA